MQPATHDRICEASRRIEATRASVEAGHPWPLAAVFDDTPEASWGPPEVLAHLAEMVTFWHGELGRVARSPDAGPVVFGRTASDAGRLATIERMRSSPPGELYDMLRSALEALQDDASTWSAKQLAAVGLHPVRGEVTVAAGIERFIVGHLEDHATQLEGLVGR